MRYNVINEVRGYEIQADEGDEWVVVDIFSSYKQYTYYYKEDKLYAKFPSYKKTIEITKKIDEEVKNLVDLWEKEEVASFKIKKDPKREKMVDKAADYKEYELYIEWENFKDIIDAHLSLED